MALSIWLLLFRTFLERLYLGQICLTLKAIPKKNWPSSLSIKPPSTTSMAPRVIIKFAYYLVENVLNDKFDRLKFNTACKLCGAARWTWTAGTRKLMAGRTAFNISAEQCSTPGPCSTPWRRWWSANSIVASAIRHCLLRRGCSTMLVASSAFSIAPAVKTVTARLSGHRRQSIPVALCFRRAFGVGKDTLALSIWEQQSVPPHRRARLDLAGPGQKCQTCTREVSAQLKSLRRRGPLAVPGGYLCYTAYDH